MYLKAPLFLLLFFSLPIFSQVGINTTSPHSSAILDITSSNKGVLFPRVSLQGSYDTSTVSSPAIGLLVYNTSSSGGLTTGYYYWNGIWTPLSGGSAGSDNWSLNGNSTSASNFIGTTNYQSLYFRVNNTAVGRIHPGGGIGFGFGSNATANNSIAIGNNASTSQTAVALGYLANASGNESIALGYNSESSYQSLAVGHDAVAGGNESIAIGFNTTSSFQNIAIGHNTRASANSAIAIGHRAVANNQNSVVVGTDATSSANSAVVIGQGTKASSQNTVVIGTSAASNGNEGVAIGNAANANYQSVALGKSTNASQDNTTAIGYNAKANNQNSTAIGTGAVASQDNAVVIGNISSANVGIGTSTPNTNAKLDVNGSFKLGENGTLQKGITSFIKYGVYVGSLNPNETRIVNITIPINARPSSTTATVIVTPANGFNDGVIVGFAKLSSTSELRILFNNIGGNFGGQSSNFYFTIIEF